MDTLKPKTARRKRTKEERDADARAAVAKCLAKRDRKRLKRRAKNASPKRDGEPRGGWDVQLPWPEEREVWRDIPGFYGYQASSLGGVRSWRSDTGEEWPEPRMLSQQVFRGYKKVFLSRIGGMKKVSVHRLVLWAFAGPAPEGRGDCRHLDGTRDNNSVNNLCWGSAQDNADDRKRHVRWAAETASPTF